MFLFDTIGISVFTLLGVQKGLNYDLHPFVAIVMGMVSAVMGGVIRDVLTNQIPLIFRKEIYASACLAGGVVLLICHYLNLPEALQILATMVTIIFIRLIAVKFHLELPKIKDDLFSR